MRRLAFALLLVLVAAGCDASDTFDVTAYVGTYEGTRVVTDSDFEDVEDITFTIQADEGSGTVTLVLDTDFSDPEVLTGTYDDDGIAVDISQLGIGIAFTVDRDGDIRGTYTGFDQSGAITGRLTPSRFDLTFTPTEAGGARTEIRTTR